MKALRFLALALFVIASGSALYAKFTTSGPQSSFKTATVKRSDLLISVSATGTVEPEEVVDVGAQVVGRIKELGIDPRSRTDAKFEKKSVDYGSPVEEGMLLAQIDPSIYSAQYGQQKASVDRAKADVLQMEAKCMQADAEWKRAQKLRALKLTAASPTGSKPGDPSAFPIKGISDADYILAQANYEMAKANVEVGKATVEQQAAALTLAETNLGYTTIKSPVNGTIIDRRVNIGQTVVSSMNAPSLFLIAKDLRKMQVWASVNEADIGRLKIDMPVQFKVDAYADEVFRGQVSQIRLNATSTQNVVTYTVVISADNPDLKLLPYLTADVKFEVEEHKDVLLVPNAALRYRPKPEQIINSTNESESVAPSNPEPMQRRGKKDAAAPKTGTLWVKQGDLLAPVDVQIGLSDGVLTEVTGEQVQEDLEVVTGEKRVEAGAGAPEVNNPFAPPRIPRRGARS